MIGAISSQFTDKISRTIGSIRRIFGQRNSRTARSGNDSICVLGFGGGLLAPLPPLEDDAYFAMAFEAPMIGEGG